MTNTPTPDELDEESSCGQPCHPDAGCGECAVYWSMMVAQGFWDNERKRWTDKGWTAIIRTF